MNRRPSGLSVAEVMFAIALLAITFVSLLSVLASGLRTERKAFYREAASATARSVLSTTLSQISRDDPPGTRASFWAADYPSRTAPFRQGTESAGDSRFTYQICTRTVMGTGGLPFGFPNHRLKQVDVYVRWGGDDARSGYGTTLYQDRRIVSEASGDVF